MLLKNIPLLDTWEAFYAPLMGNGGALSDKDSNNKEK